MTISHRYPDFAFGPSQILEEKEDALEDVKLSAFEAGYQAGWDDAAKAHAAETDKVTAVLAQRFEDMSFTYQEVYSKLALSLQPLMIRFVTKLLPKVAGQSLHAHILEEVDQLLKTEIEGAIEIAVSEAERDTLENVLTGRWNRSFQIRAEPMLKPGQAQLRVGKAEYEIDLDQVLNSISEAVEVFFSQVIQEPKNE